jgi:uncharacterized protein
MAGKKLKSPRPKHVPRRTCVACRKVDAKRGLRRLVRIEGDRVAIDPTGKRSGRGAYICNERGCWETALKRSAIERALKIAQFAPEDRQMLIAYAASLPSGDEEDKAEPDLQPANV